MSHLRVPVLLAIIVLVLGLTLTWGNRRRHSHSHDGRLTEALAEKWVEASKAAGVGAALEHAGPNGSSVNLADPEAVRRAGRNRRLSGAVKGHGFRGGEEWAEATVKMMAVALNGMLPEMQAKERGVARADAELSAAMGRAYAETGSWVGDTLAGMSQDEVDAAQRALDRS